MQVTDSAQELGRRKAEGPARQLAELTTGDCERGGGRAGVQSMNVINCPLNQGAVG